jgi:D-3-phosphoglycerate dehydrogenase
MSPRVLIADQLSPAAVGIFKERSIATDVRVGLPKEQLEEIIGEYDGLAVRSATRVTEKVLAAA